MNITPEQADRLERDATDGPWMLDQQDLDEVPMIMSMRVENGLVTGTYIAEGVEEDGDARLIAAAPDLAQTIAGMEWEYGVEQATGTTQWFGSRPMAEAHAEVRGAYRLVRRLVGTTETVGELV